ncbi:MAG TPA: hypothetical protein VIW29_11980, partial [Polyangiaceae bacterium]
MSRGASASGGWLLSLALAFALTNALALPGCGQQTSAARRAPASAGDASGDAGAGAASDAQGGSAGLAGEPG